MDAQITIKRVYKVVLSTKDQVKVDPFELEAIMAAMGSGSLVRVKQGIINPSYVVAVIEDEERRAKFLEDTKYPQDSERRAQGMEPLADIFKELPKLATQKLKQLT